MTREEYMRKLADMQTDISAYKQEQSGDLISRQAVLETLDDMDNVLDEDRTIENYKELLKECYEVLPSVKPQEKTGHWIEHEIEDTLRWLECSNCHCETHNVKHNFCPKCGAKMVEKQESEVKHG